MRMRLPINQTIKWMKDKEDLELALLFKIKIA